LHETAVCGLLFAVLSAAHCPGGCQESGRAEQVAVMPFGAPQSNGAELLRQVLLVVASVSCTLLDQGPPDRPLGQCTCECRRQLCAALMRPLPWHPQLLHGSLDSSRAVILASQPEGCARRRMVVAACVPADTRSACTACGLNLSVEVLPSVPNVLAPKSLSS
jgi:hypothetical protein